MTITIDLPADVAERLRRKAARNGRKVVGEDDVADYVQQLAIREGILEEETPAIPERNARLIALLDTFAAGDAETQRRDLAALQAVLEEDRPGQRPLFGEDVNL